MKFADINFSFVKMFMNGVVCALARDTLPMISAGECLIVPPFFLCRMEKYSLGAVRDSASTIIKQKSLLVETNA